MPSRKNFFTEQRLMGYRSSECGDRGGRWPHTPSSLPLFAGHTIIEMYARGTVEPVKAYCTRFKLDHTVLYCTVRFGEAIQYLYTFYCTSTKISPGSQPFELLQ